MLDMASLPRTEYWQDEQVEQNGERIFYNTNNLMQKDNKYYYPTCIGIKSGFTTPAKNCLIAASNKNGFEVISVILHAESTDDGQSARYVDTINLFNYAYDNYKISDILEEYNIQDSSDTSYSDIDNSNTIQTSTTTTTIEFPNDPSGKIKMDYNIIKIGVGIFCVMFGIIILGKNRKKGKHEEISKMYKFDL